MAKRRKNSVDPTLMYDTPFEGIQPDDVVKVRPKNGDEYVAIVVTISEGHGRSVDAVLGTVDGVTNVNSDDLVMVRRTGDQKGLVAGELKKLASEWRLNMKTISSIRKQMVPLIQQMGKTKLRVSSITGNIGKELKKLS